MNAKLVVLVVLSVVLLVIVLQNTETVTVKVLFWDLAMSRVLLILFTGLVGFVLGFVVAKLTDGRARSRLA